MTLNVMDGTGKRLAETDQGRALLSLINEYGTPAKLAQAFGFEQQRVRQWIFRGRISKRAAIEIEQATGRMKEEFRPDLSAEEWNGRPAGNPQGHVAVARTDDAKLLVALAKQMGTVRAVCDAAFCTVNDYHTWKSRGRIPAIKLPTFLALRK